MMICFLIVFELIIALLAMDYQKPFWWVMIILLFIVSVLSIIKTIKADTESKEIKKECLQIKIISKDTHEIVKTIAKKSERTCPNDKVEAKAMIRLKGILNIIEGYNVTCITDEGLGKMTICFNEDFNDQFYEVKITGNKGEIKYNTVAKMEGSLSIEFEEEGLEWIQIICWER